MDEMPVLLLMRERGRQRKKGMGKGLPKGFHITDD